MFDQRVSVFSFSFLFFFFLLETNRGRRKPGAKVKASLSESAEKGVFRRFLVFGIEMRKDKEAVDAVGLDGELDRIHQELIALGKVVQHIRKPRVQFPR